MKTKNNIQKAIFTSLVIGAGVVCFNGTVNAQYYAGMLAENTGFAVGTTASVEKITTPVNPVSPSENATFFLVEQEMEEPLELENWMTDGRYFSASVLIGKEVESPLSLENWMTNEKVFHAVSFHLETKTDEALHLEKWMINERNFTASTFQLIEVKDEKPELQDWMFNKDLFEKPNMPEQILQLENWMISEKIWII